jgi:hypothetical protein
VSFREIVQVSLSSSTASRRRSEERRGYP